ncbi:hypothetical protein AVEN_21502-1 [Araneus ventricosus]|uniref:Uncharacterized protein n=1 Tax=Araneus ventricosus TaxID=182803 RepID=A0A4Y2J5S2_ARAVE|nr:hypothetical protein AVEN_21502-1 [Araneus ventricosus]
MKATWTQFYEKTGNDASIAQNYLRNSDAFETALRTRFFQEGGTDAITVQNPLPDEVFPVKNRSRWCILAYVVP